MTLPSKPAARLYEAFDGLRESDLAELDESIAQNDFRAANIRAGYVYVISNAGAFGLAGTE